ncbi:hypothetical protein LB521_28015 [Mesorhizobium sp. BR-1-1-8]|uniref:hypothetical protein n=1 Tax=Mesorhizobium sp. BR-1-1-8 TaxID=2876659 RepID=UPI001CCB64D2|nr:hypothetical protein [Mesorhizobium sp. BR-1-1-8]MBZ9984985.1 hypothetical protein [Mesorhizobium sp. BR-1-1-8]
MAGKAVAQMLPTTTAQATVVRQEERHCLLSQAVAHYRASGLTKGNIMTNLDKVYVRVDMSTFNDDIAALKKIVDRAIRLGRAHAKLEAALGEQARVSDASEGSPIKFDDGKLTLRHANIGDYTAKGILAPNTDAATAKEMPVKFAAKDYLHFFTGGFLSDAATAKDDPLATIPKNDFTARVVAAMKDAKQRGML